MTYARYLLIGLVVGGVVSCVPGGTRSRPTPPMKTVTWTWEPGTCADRFRLYEVLKNRTRLVMDVDATGYRARRVMRTSTWVVSGVCAEGEFFSQPVTYVAPQ